jgi:hypothetical protein
LAVSGLKVDSQGFSIVVPTAKFNIQTAVDYDNDLANQVSLSAALEQLMLRHVATNKPVAQFDELLLDSTLSPREINIKRLAINDLQAFTQSADVYPDLLNNIDLKVSEVAIALTPEQSLKSIDVQQVDLVSAVIRLLIDKHGEMPQLAMIESLLVANNAETQIASGEALELSASLEEATDKTTADPIPITVQKIVIQPDVIVYFDDKSVRPGFSEEIRVVRAEINNVVINSAEELADIDLALGLSHNAAIGVKGQFNAHSQFVNADLTIDRFQLLSVSGYAKQAIGYALESGRFSLNSTIKVADGQLDTNNDILIDRLSLREAAVDKAKKFSHQMSMPLEQALDLLRDSDNRIMLTVPVDGAVNDPNVDVQQIINKALGSAMAKHRCWY